MDKYKNKRTDIEKKQTKTGKKKWTDRKTDRQTDEKTNGNAVKANDNDSL